VIISARTIIGNIVGGEDGLGTPSGGKVDGVGDEDAAPECQVSGGNGRNRGCHASALHYRSISDFQFRSRTSW
jgi:hypothetical protein